MRKRERAKPSDQPEPPQQVEAQALAVMLVEPLPVVNEGLGMFLDSQDDMNVVAQAHSAKEALDIMARLKKRRDMIVLVGLELSGEQDAYWLIRQLRQTYPTIVVVASSANSVKANVSRALFNGADGYINKRSSPPDFLDGLRRSAEGELVLTGVPADWFGDIAQTVANEGDARPVLTERERQILTVAAEGASAKSIAERLGLAERTVTTHLTNIYNKLGVHGRVAAITVAARSGLVSVSLDDIDLRGSRSANARRPL